MDQTADNKDTKLEQITEKLYEPGASLRSGVRSGFYSETDKNALPVWQEKTAEENLLNMKKKKPLAIRVFYASLAFFAVAAGAAVFLFLSETNVISNQNIDVAITGPVAIEGGKQLDLQVAITNKNAAALESVDMEVTYPEGTKKADGTGSSLTREQEYIGDIKSGQVVNKTIHAILYGEENVQKTITLSLEYRMPGSNSVFVKEKTYSVAISSSPLGVVVDMPKEVTSQKQVELKFTVASNSPTPVKDTLFVIQYPSGFSFESASPSPSVKNNTWKLGDFTPGQKRIITVKGTIVGQDNDIKSFKISAGIPASGDDDTIATAYTTLFKTIAIVKPSVAGTVSLNGQMDGDVVVVSGKEVRAAIKYQNNLGEKLTNVSIVSRLSGPVLDKETVNAEDGGFYQSSDNAIEWDPAVVDELQILQPGEDGEVDFSFASIPASRSDFPLGKNPAITIETTISGTRLVPGGSSEKVETRIVRTVKISSAVQLSARALYSTGPFTNHGTVPPTAEKPTSYTVVWSVQNSSSDIYSAFVQATLPPNVKWLGVYSPTNEDVSYSVSANTVRWNIGDIRAGTGVTGTAREVSFQVELTPSVSQIGEVPAILNQSIFSGTDSYAKTAVGANFGAVTTNLIYDPAHRNNDGEVTR